jgi:hypothetical protein
MTLHTCARCGRQFYGLEGMISRADDELRHYCHNDRQRPSCYELQQWEDAGVSAPPGPAPTA